MQHDILIHSTQHETRVAITAGHAASATVQELHIERHAQRGVVSNVYLGKVIRVLPGMQSAFLDVGLDKAAFLHVADVLQAKQHMAKGMTKGIAKGIDSAQSEQDTTTATATATATAAANALTIEKLVFVGQTLLVQVLKDPLGSKGARLTTQISLAGRYMVLLPQDTHIGMSQKITDAAQRSALRERLTAVLPLDFKQGLIARTQAEEASTEQLASDIAYLQQVWSSIEGLSKTQPAPALLHSDLDLAQRTLRDLCNEHTRSVQVDGASSYASLLSFAQRYMPAVLNQISLHTGEHGLFELAQVDAEVNAALQRRVNLPSGAYLVIDQTESMCTIDVNTGSYVGSKNFADTVFKTNLEAVQAIARQLRLRNLGGIILIDFIDMPSDSQREQVRSALVQALSHDPVRSHVHGFTALGLVELTRKRVRESLAHVMMQPCECCQQTGQIKTAQTVGYEILREIELQARQFNCQGFEIKLSPTVADWFYDAQHNTMLHSLESELRKSIRLVSLAAFEGQQFEVLPI